MSREEIRELIRNTPRKPLRLCMDDGRRYTVSHPDFALAGPDAVVLASGPGHDFGASYVICYFEHIARIELIPRPKARTGK